MAISDIDSTLVTVGQPVEGGACWAAFGTPDAYPTDAAAKMSTIVGYESVGELSTEGFTEGKSINSTEHKGWHGTTVLTDIDSTTDTYKASLIEVSRGTAAKLRYGSANVTVDAATGAVSKIEDKGNGGEDVSLVFDELESNGWLRRTVVKRCRVTSLDDVPHKKGALMEYGMTFTVLDPADGGARIVVYRAKPAGPSPASQPSGK